ncbi:C40 family peptidase [Planococcus lenghuensis]|uniref:NlpC/P60 domain-containing protein n=1 Tax=Planococcus lenghuensis TaxID=2213202 RepID=A0A1Q2L234_9BACL|nr:C40 family peptidase [Planococcus lenghuensis]AQQ54499.1 hypothetical protein B0X71_16245 [Planococcus lenghuensis]
MKKTLLLTGAAAALGTSILFGVVSGNTEPAENDIAVLQGREVVFEALPAAPAVKGVSTSQASSKVLDIAGQYLGADYLLGASTSRTDAFDCSSFTKRVFSQLGIELPRSSSAQAQIGEAVAMDELQVGDLLFFATSGSGGVSHAGIYAGNGEMVSAQNGGVKYAPVDEGYWADRFLFAKRVS